MRDDERLRAVHERISVLPPEKKHEAARCASCSYSAPQTAVFRGAKIDGNEAVWPDGERYPIGSGRCFTVRAHDAAETVLVEHVDMPAALEAHEAANGHATIYDDSDGQPARMAEYCHMGACECHRCEQKSGN